PAYMSPEQIKEEPLDNQTDIFSLGVVFYELITGRSPFYADKFAGVVRKVLYFDPPPISVYRSDAPMEIDAIIRKAMNKKKSNRFLTAGEFSKALNLIFGNLRADEEDIDRSEKFMLIRNMSFFKSFTDSEIWEIVGAVSVREFVSGADIITEGSLEETFYIIIDGQAAMLKGENQIGILQKGDCFGEMGYLAKSKNSATIKAISNLKLLEVNNYAIEESSTACQLRFTKIFLKRIIERLAKVNVEL
ncbi:MAG: cyclic nucleotide-binding domain-containing protein, partial [Thermodesulfovibrionales bacterium]|nr:cyclic nucleotide-binding domain-containing protein [Thermodesulfovibrionales bacterium]